MKINEYQKLCMRTANFMDSSKLIANGAWHEWIKERFDAVR